MKIVKEHLFESYNKFKKSENNLRTPYFLSKRLGYIEKIDESFSKGDDDKLRRLGIGYLRFTKEQLEEALTGEMNELWTPPKTDRVIASDFKVHGRVTAFTLNVSNDDGQTFNDKNDNPVNYRLEGERLYSTDEEYGLEMKYKGLVKTFTTVIYALTHPEKWEEI